jgi:glycosyltransferase involved in cell wall biosynthesis
MKILFLARRFYPYIGGVEKHVFEISKILIQSGHEVSVITELGDQRNIKHFEIKDRIKIYRINAGPINKNQKITIWRELLSCKKVIQDADVVHCHDVFFWYLPFRFLFPNKPVYTTFHGYEGYPIAKKAIAVRKLSEKLSWGNICIGDFIKKWYGTNPTYVSYGAVDLPQANKEKVKKESALFFGRLDDQTGILTYDAAIDQVKKEYPNFDFLVIGDGEYKSKIDKRTKVKGFQDSPEKYFATYRFAFVSRYLSILEAFAAKRLVFAVYDNPVKEDYLRMAPYAGFIIITKNQEELAKKIMYYLQHPEKEKELVEKAYDWAKVQTWTKFVNLYLKLWERKSE